MLSDEEKNVIDLLKNIDKQKCLMLNCPVVKNNIERQLKIIELNRIIRKQSKEIEELKENNGYHLGFIDGGIAKRYEYEEKIKAKIEEYREQKDLNIFTYTEYEGALKFGQSLLEKE